MTTYSKSFQISNIVYDADMQKLTFEFNANGIPARRVKLGARTDEDIASELKKILDQYYTAESEV